MGKQRGCKFCNELRYGRNYFGEIAIGNSKFRLAVNGIFLQISNKFNYHEF